MRVVIIKESGAGAAAGFLPDDVLESIDGHAINTSDDLRAIMAAVQPGLSLRCKVLRDGVTMEMHVKVGSRNVNFDGCAALRRVAEANGSASVQDFNLVAEIRAKLLTAESTAAARF